MRTAIRTQWSGRGWDLTVSDRELALGGVSSTTVQAEDADGLSLARNWFRWVLLNEGRRVARLPGLKGAKAQDLELALNRLRLMPAVALAVDWHLTVAAPAFPAETPGT